MGDSQFQCVLYRLRVGQAGVTQDLDLQGLGHFLPLCGQCVYSFAHLKKYDENPMG